MHRATNGCTTQVESSRTSGLGPGACLAPEGIGRAEVEQTTHRLLIVEDDFFTAAMNQTALEGAGYEIVGTASSFEQAVQLAEAERPDLAIMDIRLASARDGVEAAVEIMQRFGIPSLFVSAFADQATRERADAAQPAGWLSKPFTIDQLLGSVRAALDRLPR